MDILFVTLSPIDATFSMSYRNRALLSGFVKLGHSVDVMTIYPYDSSIQIKTLELSNYGRILRLNNPAVVTKNRWFLKKGASNLISNFFRSIYHRLIPYDSSYFLIKNLHVSVIGKNKYDTVISSSDPITSHLAVKRLISTGLLYKNWIQYWGDPLANDITSKLIYPKAFLNCLEKYLLKGADKIVYVSPITCKEQAMSFKNYALKMFFLPIPYENEKIYPSTKNNKFIVGYFGFYLKSVRNIVPLYNSVKKGNGNIHLNIVGSTDLKLKDCPNISIYPNSNDISKYESNSDLIVVILNLRGGQIPGKLYQLAATNKPILVIMDGDFKEVIREYLEKFERFIMCENSEESISDAISKQALSKKEFFPSRLLSSTTIARGFLQ
jgi:glycosyltransferase involved in cell wall biosynthesis